MSSDLKSRLTSQVKAQMRPTPWGELSPLRRARRVTGMVFGLASLAMAAAASTASSDWNITQADVEKQFG